MRFRLLLGAWCLFAGFLLFASLYCILCYIPFTYQQFLKADVIPALGIFARLHPVIYLVVLLLAAPAIGFRNSWLSCGFWMVHAPAAAVLLVHPVLKNLESSIASLVWGLVHLATLAWISALSIERHYPEVRWQPE